MKCSSIALALTALGSVKTALGGIISPYLNATITASPSTTASGAAVSCASYGVNALYDGLATDPALYCQCITQFQNWYETTDPPTRTVYKTIGVGATTQTITSGGSTIVTSFADLTTFTATFTGNQPGADGFDWYGTAMSPCCSSCTIAVATVELFYFPTPAISGAATSFTSNGYTFISPSVYIGFTSLYAYDFCGDVGNVYTSTTLTFDPTEISSLGSPISTTETTTQTYFSSTDLTTEATTYTKLVGGPASQIDFRDLAQNCSSISGYSFLASEPFQDWFVTYDPCHPTIILPSQVKSLDPAWATCLDNPLGGFYDPPYSLTEAPPLEGATSTSASPSPTSTIPPSTTAEPTTTSVPALSDTTPSSSSPGVAPPPSSTTPTVVEQTSTTPIIVPPTISTSTPVVVTPSTGDPGTTVTTQTTAVSSPADPGTSPATTVGTTSSLPISVIIEPTSSTTQAIVVGTQTVQPGSAVTQSGTTISFASSGAVVINGQTLTPPSQTSPAVSVIIDPSASTTQAIVIGTQIIQPGSAITTAGTTISLSPTGGAVIINGATTTIPSATPSSQVLVINSQTLVPGSTIVVSGTTYSAASTGSSVFVNGIPTTLVSSTQEAFVIGTHTVLPGSAVTVSGTTYSLASTGGSVIVNGVPTTQPAIGSIIMSLISPETTSSSKTGGNATATSSGLVQVTGNVGSKLESGLEGGMVLAVGLVGVFLVL